MTPSTPKTLLDLLPPDASGQTAVVIPEQNIKITYAGLRDQVESLASALRGQASVAAIVSASRCRTGCR